MGKKFKLLFWDTDYRKVDPKKKPHYVIERVLEYGDIPHVRWMRRYFRTDEIKEVVTSASALSPKAANFWADFYQIPKNQVKCLTKQSLKRRKTFWPY